jgi:hypothetical protein
VYLRKRELEILTLKKTLGIVIGIWNRFQSNQNEDTNVKKILKSLVESAFDPLKLKIILDHPISISRK